MTRIEPEMSFEDMIGLIEMYNQDSAHSLVLLEAKDRIQSLHDIPAFIDWLFDNYKVDKK